MAPLSSRAILSVRYTAVSRSIKASVGRFLRYVQYRDHSQEREGDGGIDGFLRYAAYRDRTTPAGRLFDRDGDATEGERRRLAGYIERSVAGLPEKARQGRAPHRAAYRLVISPENAEGIDLRQLTRSTMAALEREAGLGGLPPWIAAEHRNTAHPHVHVVMAARRELEDGRFRTLVIARPRLQRMKDGMGQEMSRQRGREHDLRDPFRRLFDRYQRGPGRGSSHSREWSAVREFQWMTEHYAAEMLRDAERHQLEWMRGERER